jgi:FAD/FMN-containing dehydrogenase
MQYQDFLKRVDGRVAPRAIVPPAEWDPFVNGLRCAGGVPLAVLAPGSVDELRAIVRVCVEAGLPVVPQGANSGLVGASVPDASGRHVVLLTRRLGAVRQLAIADAVAVVEAGVRLSQLNFMLEPHRLQLGIDLGADPSIGGMIATNTGGSRMMRYGDMRRHVLGLEVVLADRDATMISNLRLTRKDNGRVGWAPLVSGAGGAMGIVTAAAIELDPLPQQSATMLMALGGIDAVPDLVIELRRALGEFLSACEIMSKAATGLKNPFRDALPAQAMLVEVSSGLDRSAVDVEAVLLGATERLFAREAPGVEDALVVPPPVAWALRHAISDSLKMEGEVIGLDIGLPLAALPAFHAKAAAMLAADFPWLKLCDFGHCGDGGVHFNLVWPSGTGPAHRESARDDVRMRIYEAAVGVGGSFSAEHGLGPSNAAAFARFTPPDERQLTQGLRRIFDPWELLARALPPA